MPSVVPAIGIFGCIESNKVWNSRRRLALASSSRRCASTRSSARFRLEDVSREV